MAITSRDLHSAAPEASVLSDIRRINITRIAAVVLWVMGAWLTEQTLTYRIHTVGLAWAIACLIQLCLTRLESSLWQPWHSDGQGRAYRGKISPAVWPALLVDMLCNMPGTWWGIVETLHQWPPLVVIGEIGGWTIHPIRGIIALVVTALIAVVPCALPELLWYAGKFA